MKQHRKEKNLKRVQFNLPIEIVDWIDESVESTKESKSAFVARMLDTIRVTQKKLSEV